jgi:hypothetical protein
VECLLPGTREKFSISISERGLAITSAQGSCVHFSASEALMLLDILQHEAERLRILAAEDAPIPFRCTFSP